MDQIVQAFGLLGLNVDAAGAARIVTALCGRSGNAGLTDPVAQVEAAGAYVASWLETQVQVWEQLVAQQSVTPPAPIVITPTPDPAPAPAS